MKNQILTTATKSIKYWYVPLIMGLIFLGTGIYTFMVPLESYLTLALLFGISFLVSGIMEVVFSIANRKHIENWGWSLVSGILSLAIGILLIMRPDISLLTLPIYVGFWVFFRSIMAIGVSIDLKRFGILDWGNLMLVGVFGLMFSFFLLWNPLFAGITIVVWTGLALISVGIFGIYFAFKLKKLKKMFS
ncbi:HdeD family acid-resistance protein [Ulvibacterium sp.]|uniref:HdeD family acid-resistance protein n=1 Tax=Ulvibacterium sp. TaxID=2665914 RepID=UPI0026280B16|nr:DUF308 domain-containing protein [Ulvibacterium sp.]